MNTFLKRIFSLAPGHGVRVHWFLVIGLLVIALVADRAISQGKDVSFALASILTLTTTTPAAKASEPRSPATSRSESAEDER